MWARWTKFMLWLVTWASKMKLSSPLRTTRLVPWQNFALKSNNKSFIDHAFLVNMAGYWPCSFFFELVDLDSTKTQNKNLANIQPSWPHAWSITYIYDAFSCRYFLKKSILEKVERLRISRYSKDSSSILYSTSIYKTPVHVFPKLLSMTHTQIISDMNAKQLRNQLKHIKSIRNGMCILEMFSHVR